MNVVLGYNTIRRMSSVDFAASRIPAIRLTARNAENLAEMNRSPQWRALRA